VDVNGGQRTKWRRNIAVVPCENKIILKNFRPEPPPSVDRPKIFFYFSMEPQPKWNKKNFSGQNYFI